MPRGSPRPLSQQRHPKKTAWLPSTQRSAGMRGAGRCGRHRVDGTGPRFRIWAVDVDRPRSARLTGDGMIAGNRRHLTRHRLSQRHGEALGF
jgi:hypothetical protein